MATDTLPELDAQYRELREGAGFLPRRDRAVVAVTGPEAAEYLQGQLTNDVEVLKPGEGCYAALLDRKGHMQADMTVLRIGTGELLLQVEEVARDVTVAHLSTYKVGRDVAVTDRSAEVAVLSAIGPAVHELSGAPPLPSEHAHLEAEIGGVGCRVVSTGDGIDLLCPSDAAGALADGLVAAGLSPVEEAAAEIARVESGRPRFGREMGPQTIPAEAGIVERAVNFEKGCYIGQETVARLHYKGKPNRHLRGLRLDRPVEAGTPLRLGDREVGSIGSACLSPAFGPIGLAIVRREAAVGDTLRAGDEASAEVVDLPFH